MTCDRVYSSFGCTQQMMIAEGRPLDVVIVFPGSAHPSARVLPSGDVDRWPESLFGEDFEDVRARWRAQA